MNKHCSEYFGDMCFGCKEAFIENAQYERAFCSECPNAGGCSTCYHADGCFNRAYEQLSLFGGDKHER